MNDQNEEYLGLGWFLNELAKRANFTHADTRLLYDKMVEIIREIVAEKKTLVLTRFIKITFTKIHREKSWDGLNKKWIGPQDFRRMRIIPSLNLKRLYYTGYNKTEKESDEGEFE